MYRPLGTTKAAPDIEAAAPVFTTCPQCSKLVEGSCIPCKDGEKHPSCLDCKDGRPPPPPPIPWYQGETTKLIFATVTGAVLTAVILSWMGKK